MSNRDASGAVTWVHGDSVHVVGDGGRVGATDTADVLATDDACVDVYFAATCTAFDRADVMAFDESFVSVSDTATVSAYGRAAVNAYDDATVLAHGMVTVEAHGRSRVIAYGSALVEAHDEAVVAAGPDVTVRRRSAKATVSRFDGRDTSALVWRKGRNGA